MQDSPDPPDDRGRPGPAASCRDARRSRIATVLLVLAGVGCRAAQYAANPSLWHDEALVAVNVMNRPLSRLVGGLDYAQAAPPLFLFAERGLLLALGRNEYALRLVSFVCGTAALVLFAVLCWRLFPPGVAPWVVAFFALSDKLIWHSAEAKPYGGDALVAVVLLFIVIGWRRRSPAAKPPRAPRPSPASPASPLARLALLAAVASCAVWFSFPAAIMFGGLSLMLLPQVVRRRSPRGLAAYAALNLAVACSFLLLYHYTIKPQHVPYLSGFWAADFPDSSRPWTTPAWLAGEIYSLCDQPFRSFGFFTFALAAAGIAGWRRRGGGDALAACLLPLGLAVGAAFLRQYPFNGGRLSVYLLPGLLLMCGGGLVVLRDLLGGTAWPWRLSWAAAAAVVVGRGAVEAAVHLAVPRSASGARPVVAYVRGHRRPGEGLYLVGNPVGDPSRTTRYYYSSPLSLALLFYWRDPPPPWHAGMPVDLSQIPEQRFWIVFTTEPGHLARYLRPLVDQLRPYAVERTEYRFEAPRGAGAGLLFERVRQPGATRPAPAPKRLDGPSDP